MAPNCTQSLGGKTVQFSAVTTRPILGHANPGMAPKPICLPSYLMTLAVITNLSQGQWSSNLWAIGHTDNAVPAPDRGD